MIEDKIVLECKNKRNQLSSRYNIDDNGISLQINIIDILKILWESKITIIIFPLTISFFIYLYSLTIPNLYKSEALLAPSGNDSEISKTMFGQFDGIVNLAGIDLPNNNNLTKAIATLKSRQFIIEFINKYQLKVELLGMKYDIFESKIKIDKKLYDIDRKSWLNSYGQPDINSEPTDWQAYKIFSEILKIVEDKKNGLIKIQIEWHDPVKAKEWVNLIVTDINKKFKEKDKDEANRSILYLKEQLQKTKIVEMKKALYQLIEQQTKIVMFAEVRDNYIFSIIDSAMIPENKSNPKRKIFVILGFFLGLIISIIFVLVKCINNFDSKQRGL